MEHLAKGLSHKSNFQFLGQHDEQLVRIGMLAERYFADDPNTCLIKTRQFGEVLAKHLAANLGLLDNAELTQHELLGRLNGHRVVSRDVITLFHELRKTGNRATHDLEGDHRAALMNLKVARQLAIWFHRTFKQRDFKPGAFIPPPDPGQESLALRDELARLREERDKHLSDAERLAEEREAARRAALAAEERAREAAEEGNLWEQLAQEAEKGQKELAAQLAELQTQSAKQSADEFQTLVATAEQASAAIDLDEAATREIIDQQLRDAGWEVDSQKLRYSLGACPQRARRLAIAEWPTKTGPADYVLFDGLMAIGVVEAKRKNIDVAGALDQAKRYSRDFLTKDACDVPGGPWGEYKIPFVFSSNGRPFLQQLRTQSGIWFCDIRRPQNLSKPMDGWYSPAGLTELFKQNIDSAEQKLEEIGFGFDFPLRPYQKTAIQAVEKAIKDGKQTALLAMATGTGKTKTCIALVYRLLKAQRFRRILFLVDRTALGEQAANDFKDTRIENLQTFAEIFGILEINDPMPEKDTKVQIATVQGMVRRVLFTEDEANQPTVDQYDCIVVDECHRGYLLDRELSDTELTFRDQGDYISKYRRVLDYFDAVKIGLTATPALHTTEIFGAPIFTYSYREAVLDNYLIDHEPPFIIETELSQKGIEWKVGEEVTLYDTQSQSVETAYAPDEIKFDVSAFNKQVITEPFNRVVCQQLAQHIDPMAPGKTLVFCATDRHADMVVDLLKHAFSEAHGGVDDDAVKKITGTSDKPLELIRRYKNEKLPSVAVTVDLLTTGIDVPEITSLVFLRRVNSRILYEQMLGRATRKCDEIGKEVFHVFDAVGLYENLDAVSTMKPVVQVPNISFDQLVQEMVGQTDPAVRQQAKDQFLAKFQRRRHRISDEGVQAFEAQAGMSPNDFIDELKTAPVEEMARWFTEHPGLTELLDRKTKSGTPYIFISEHDDQLVDIHRGYGGAEKPEDYLKAFGEFIDKNRNTIPALVTVLTRPRELTRQELKNLVLELERHGFNERQLKTAWQETTNQATAARIIGYVRQAALGDPLKPYEQRVDEALQRVQKRHQFTPVQQQWLERISKQMKANLVVDRDALDEGVFKQQAGGFTRLNKIFNGDLENIIGEINEAALSA